MKSHTKKQKPFSSWIILINIIFIAIISIFSTSAGFLGQSATNGALSLSQDAARWISISLIMILGTVLPLSIFFAEKYGYKVVFFCGLIVLLLGSLLNFFSFNFWSFFISRAIAGIGSGTVFPLSIPIIRKAFAHKVENLPLALSLYIGIGFGVGTFLALWGGGYLMEYSSWKAPFLISFLTALPLLLTTWLIHPKTTPNPLKKFNIKGYIYFIAFISLLLIITVNVKAAWNTEGWSSGFIVSCFFLLAISLVLLIWNEINNKNPIIAFSLFKIKSFLLGCIAIFVIGFFLYSTQMMGIIFFDQILHYEVRAIGNYIGTLGITLGICSTLSAILTKLLNIRILAFAGLMLIVLSCWLNPTITVHSNHAQILNILNLRMLGIALALGPATSLAMSDVPPLLTGTASVFVTLTRQIGGTLGGLIGNIIITTRTHFHNQIFSANITPQAPAFQETALHIKNHLIRTMGTNPYNAQIKTQAIITENLVNQSLAASMNDFFFVAGIGALFVSIALLLEWIHLKRMFFFLKH
jgi:MFS transporter, DHA2 family, multidrug resistance protein